MTYSVDGTVTPGDGAPGNVNPACASSSARALSTIWIAIAWFGHACTHAGASLAASRSVHMSHLRTMPRFLL